LVAGLAVMVFGGVLLRDATDVVDLRFGAVAPLTLALLGTILLTSGLSRRG
jgi:hypothetical protein